MRKKPVVFLLLGVLLVLVLSACGGGGGGTTTAPAAIQFALSTDKPNLLSDNIQTATITATFASTVADGTAVVFSVPANTATLAVPGTATSGAQVTATTSGNKAAVTIKGNNLDAQVKVTATSGSITKDIPITFNTTLSANANATKVVPGTAVQINIMSSATSATDLSVAVSPATGVTVVQPVQSGTGQFTATVTPNVLGTITVTVTQTGSNSPSTVTFDSIMPIPMSVTPPGNILANGVDAATVTADFTGITIADGEPVTFSATNGAILSTSQALVNANKATVNVTSSTAGTSLVTASYKGSAGSTNVVFVQPQFSITASKSTALANNSDTVTLTVTLDGAANGTPIALAVSPASATLGNNTVTTTNGTATTTLKSGTAGTVTVTATANSATATTTVSFIAQPTAMDVFVALNPAQPSLASLQFVVDTGAGATVPPTATVVNAAATGSFVAVGPGSAANTTNVALINATGFNTMTAPIIKLTYTITGSGLPGAQINTTAPISAFNAALQPITLTPQNFVITTEYR